MQLILSLERRMILRRGTETREVESRYSTVAVDSSRRNRCCWSVAVAGSSRVQSREYPHLQDGPATKKWSFQLFFGVTAAVVQLGGKQSRGHLFVSRRYKILATAMCDANDTLFSRVAALEHSDTNERGREAVLDSQLESIIVSNDPVVAIARQEHSLGDTRSDSDKERVQMRFHHRTELELPVLSSLFISLLSVLQPIKVMGASSLY